MRNLQVLKKEDGFWLSVDGPVSALVHLDVKSELVKRALEGAVETDQLAVRAFSTYDEDLMKFIEERIQLRRDYVGIVLSKDVDLGSGEWSIFVKALPYTVSWFGGYIHALKDLYTDLLKARR